MNRWLDDHDLDLYFDVVKAEVGECSTSGPDLSPAEGSPGLDWDNEMFNWDKTNLESYDLSDILPVSVKALDDDDDDAAAAPSPSSPLDPTDVSAGSVVAALPGELLARYGLSDDQLSEMPLKQLKRRCAADDGDYQALKSYRRTCLNRSYARSSRSKQHEKAQTLTTQLRDAREELRRLEKTLEERDMRIRYLELENRLLHDFHQKDD